MDNNLLGKIGRFLFALPFVAFGVMHFTNASAMTGMVPIPGGAFWVYLTGAAFLAASASFLIEKKARLAGLLLGVMLLIFVFSIRLPAVIAAESAQAMQGSMGILLKELALAGGAWILAGMYEGEASSASSPGSSEEF